MTDDEYNRLYPIIHGRLSEEEQMFWAKEAALNCDFANRREQRWKRLALFWSALSLVLSFILGWVQ